MACVKVSPIALAIVVACAAMACAAAGSTRPNIIWVMADDLGYGEVGAYPCTSPHGRIATPTLDRFANEGMQFTQAYAGYTVCAPSRTALFTGRHSGQYVKYGLSGTAISPGQATVTSELLQQAGYETAIFGKTAPLTNPVEQGFGTFLGQVNQGYCHNMYPAYIDSGNETLNFELPLNTKKKNRSLTMANPAEYNFTVDITRDHSLMWVDDYAARRAAASAESDVDPFFLYISYTVPHAGGWGDAPKEPEQGAPVPSDGQYAGQNSWPDVEKDHAAVITYLDTAVSDLLQKLDATGLDGETIVFFASDNGAHLEGGHDYHFFNSTGGLLGHKRSLFEGGVRSPTMVRWPGHVEAGSVSTLEWAFWDVMPTLLDLAQRPDLVPEDIDGISIAPTLLGKQGQKTHDYLYWTWRGTGVPPEFDPYDELLDLPNAQQTPGFGVRSGKWKGVVPHCADGKALHPTTQDANSMQLYDLSVDPFETTDVSKANPSVVKSLINSVVAANVTCHCYQC